MGRHHTTYLQVTLQLLANEFVVKDAACNRQAGPFGLLHHALEEQRRDQSHGQDSSKHSNNCSSSSSISDFILKMRTYLTVVVMVRRLDMFLYQVGLHGNEKVTCCAVGGFHLPHEVLHAEICTKVRQVSARSSFMNAPTHTLLLLLLPTPGEVLLFVHLADGGAVVLQLAYPVICLLELVLQILL